MDIFEKSSFIPENIYNLDESGVSTVPKQGRVIAPKGIVGRNVSAEKGTNVTLVCAINATGNSVPFFSEETVLYGVFHLAQKEMLIAVAGLRKKSSSFSSRILLMHNLHSITM